MNNMSDGVGKKIVEALKMHDTGAEQVIESQVIEQPEKEVYENEIQSSIEQVEALDIEPSQTELSSALSNFSDGLFGQSGQSYVDAAFQQSLVNNLGVGTVAQINDDFDYPANVAVLKQLIAKLPAGVSKQTGALIIKQTMEALGISMSSVLQEAKQVQETFISNAKECQNNIVDYRQQISILEQRVQQYQKQSVVMNDIINLFFQTGVK